MASNGGLRARAAGTAMPGNEVDQRGFADRKAAEIKTKIHQMEQQFQLAMPRGVEAAQLIRDAMTVISANPQIGLCDQRSVLGGLMTCAQLGLRPGVLGQAWLIPFKGKAQLIIGYQGLLSLANRSGDIASISARMVHEKDIFEMEYGLDERLVHKPGPGQRGPVTGYYCVVRTKSGGRYWEYISVADAEEHRDKFAMARKDGKVVGPWVDHFDSMALKTAIIRTLKLAPRNTELQTAIDIDGSVRMDITPTADPGDVSAAMIDADYDLPPQSAIAAQPGPAGPARVDPATGEVTSAAGIPDGDDLADPPHQVAAEWYCDECHGPHTGLCPMEPADGEVR